MAKLTLVFLAAFALSLVVLASASFHATITLDEEEAAESQRGQSCEQQMQQQQMLNHCQMYMQEQRRGGGRDDNQAQHLSMCCSQLRRMDSQCRCPAIRRMMEQGMGSEQQMMEMAENLPSMCRPSIQPMRCRFRSAAMA